MPERWKPDSWRGKPVVQMPDYPDGDALAAEGPLAGEAAFNGAYISQLAAGAGATGNTWREIAARYEKAADLLVDIRHKRLADERRVEATETAKAIEARQAP